VEEDRAEGSDRTTHYHQRRMRRLGPLLRPLLLTAVAGGGVAALSLAGILRPFDLPAGDLLLRLRAAVGSHDPADSPVAAVVLDDASLDAFGPLPWPRERLAAVIRAIHRHGARAVAVDLVLNEPGTPEGDAALAAALDRRPSVLAAALRTDGGWLLPLQRFDGTDRAAHAEAELGPDGVVRTILATKQRRGLALPAVSLAAARLLRPELAITPGMPLQPDFRLAPSRVPRVAALELLATPGSIDSGRGNPLAGRLVFVGTTATAASDQFLVPTWSRPAPGVLIHASAAASLVRDGLVRLPTPLTLVAACLALSALAQAGRGRAGRLRLAHFLALAIGLAVAGAAALLLVGLRLPLVTLGAAFGASALLREAAESTLAQRDTGRLLRRLLAEERTDGPSRAPGGDEPRPRGATGRLELAREIQERVIRDRNLRRALLDSLEDGVIQWSADGRAVLANAAARRLWGEEPPPLEEILSAVSAERHPARSEAETEGATFAHGGRELHLLLRPLEEGDTLGVLRDVTAERELESRRREMQRMVSHELKTPLASIASFGGMLERYELSDEELARVAGLIRGESERLLRMVTTFLDLERIGSGRWAGEREPVDLAALARERREVLQAAAEERGIELTLGSVGGPDGDCRVSGDRELLGRVIDNLVGNAIKYSPAGGRVDVRICRAVSDSAEVVELAVSDQGPGIPPEAREHLFERFYRVPRTGRTSGASGPQSAPENLPEPGGSGLGLALVREIAEWHGGCVTLESEVGRGSVFTVRIPPLTPPAQPVQPVGRTEGPGEGGTW
jgi:signal transduction histidine kinase